MAKKANAKQNDAAPAELRKLAVQAVKHKATIDDANFKKRELRETLVRLQEALEERRAEERRIAEEARSREEEEARIAAEEEERRRAEEEARLAAEAEAEESEESEEEDEEPEPEQQAPEAEEEESSEEEEEDADELMPEPTLRGRVARGMVPFMARAAARPMPPAPRRKALPPPPPVVAVTPESESESEEEEEPVKVECDEASAEEIESEDEEEPEDEVEEEDAIVEVTRRPARRGYPEPSFEGLEALRAAPKDYHELAAALASAGVSIEGGERPLLDFRRDLITSARVAAVTITVHHAKRDRDIEIDEEGDIAAQTAACVREIREATKALNPIKTKLRAFEGQKASVPGGRVSIGLSKEAVYGRRPASSSNPTRERRGDECSRTGYAIFVDRGVWNKLDEEVQDACVDAGLITLKGAAAASVALTVRDIGEAPPVPRKRAAPKKSRKPAKKGKLSAVVRAKRGVTYYK